MGFIDILLLIVIAAAAILAICFIRRNKGSCSGCSGNCSNCAYREEKGRNHGKE